MTCGARWRSNGCDGVPDSRPRWCTRYRSLGLISDYFSRLGQTVRYIPERFGESEVSSHAIMAAGAILLRETGGGNPKDRVASTSSQGLSLTPDTARPSPDLS